MFFRKKILGIDIGTNAIKVVELSALGNKIKLENYGEVQSGILSQDSLLSVNENGELVSNNIISSAIRSIVKEAKIRTKKVVFSLPDFLTFATSFEIPVMPEKEIEGAVYYNASRYLTLPTADVTLDWRIVSNNANEKKSSIKIFLVAVSNQVIKEYSQVAKSAGLELYALEPEVFGVARSLIGDNMDTICLLDMGAKTSTVNIVDAGLLKRSYSFDFSGNRILDTVSSSLGMKVDEVKKIKTEEGILSKKEDVVRIEKKLIDQFFSEIKNILAEFLEQEKKPIKEFYLTGGLANMPGLKEYFKQNFKISVYMPNYFSEFSHPRILEDTLIEMSPRFSATVGVALGILES